jgi:hypothetical protein
MGAVMTTDAIPITSTWTDVNTASGIDPGIAVTIQSVGGANDIIVFAISDSQPAASLTGHVLPPFSSPFYIAAGQSTIWARVRRQNNQASSTAKIQISTERASYTPVLGSVSQLVEPASQKTLLTDAWSRVKAVHDNSLLHGMFTFNVPVTKWKESINGVEQPSFSNATSVNGKLVFTSNGVLNDKVMLSTFRNPRYEPNRGHLYSSSIFLPNPDAAGQRTFGIFTDDAGYGFRLIGDGATHQLYGVRRTTINSVVSDTLTPLSHSTDLTKGNTYDLPFQWRGVGNSFYFVNQELSGYSEVLGTLDELSTFNPAAPIAFECINQGDDVTIQCGCVDVSSEGGEDNGKTYGSQGIDNEEAEISIPGPNQYNTPVLVIKNKRTISSLINTRDVLSLLATAYSSERAVFRVWATRDDSVITLNDQAYTDYGDGHLEYIMYSLNADGTPIVGTPISFDATGLKPVFGTRVDANVAYSTSALFEGRTEIYQTPGDIFIFTMHRDNGGSTSVGVTYEFAEAI